MMVEKRMWAGDSEKGMKGCACGERDAGRGLWEKGCRDVIVGKGMQGCDCGKRDAGRGLWGKG